MSEMVERVAQALITHFEIRPDTNITVLARVAIAAMRDPTEEMLSAALELDWDEQGVGTENMATPTRVWQALIDEALKD